MGMEIVCWTILALSVLIFISLIGYGGSLGRSLSDLLFGLFGTNAYVFPFLLLFLTLYQLVNRGNRIALIRFFSIIALFLVFCGILMLVMLPQATLFSIKDYYDFGAAYHRGGGAVGGALILFFKPTVGVVGTYLVLFIAVFILAALITQKSIFMETGQKSTEALEEHRVRSAQVREERREEKRELEKARREMKRAKLEAQKAAYEAQMMERAAGDEGGGIAASPIFYSVLRKEDPNEEGAGKQSENNKPLFTTDLFSGDSKKKKGKRKQLTPADVIFVDSLDADADGKDLSSAGASASAAAGAASAASSAGRMPEDGGLTGGLTGSAAAAVSASAGTKASLAGLSSDRNAGSVSPGRKKKKASQDFLLFPNDSGEGNEEDFEDEDDLFSIADASASRGERSAPGRSGSAGAAASLRGNNSSGRRNKLSSLVTDAADAGDDADFASGEALSPDLVINRGSVSSEPVEEEADTGDDLPGAVVSAEDIHNAAPSVRKAAGRDEASKEAESSGRKKGKESGEEASDERKKPLSAKKEAALESERQLDAVSKEIEEKECEEEDIPYEFPSLDFLARPSAGKNGMSDDDLKETATKLVKVLEMFGVRAKVMNISCGPSVTRYELMPELGTKVSKITGLADDIKLNMAAADVRIEAPIPGKAAVGIEIPNKETSMVCLRELIDSKEFRACQSKKLSYVVGKDIAGRIIVSDIAKMPHLMIAGATGSGKSVFINTLVMSILYNADPNEVKLIMIDPKVVELSVYNGIPHLYIPVVTDPKKAAGALNWGVAEMTRRYELFAGYGVRNLAGFNAKVDSFREQGIPDTPKRLPQIVIIVDELADLMMVSGNEVEDAICRLAQLARACGIHLVIATQRPSVDVITGLIKANIPSRIAFSVSSGTDSRTILDMVGAEKLLGNGDMLFAPQTFKKPLRVQGAFVSDEEIQAVVDAIRIADDGPGGSELMKKRMAEVQKASSGALGGAGGGDVDELFADAGRFIIQKDKASIGMLQRWFKIGFNRAARIMDQLSDAGVVGADEGTKPRKVLMSEEQFENYLEQN